MFGFRVLGFIVVLIALQCWADAPNVQLRNGVMMPVLAMGSDSYIGDKLTSAVASAVQAGFRHFDTAYTYGTQEGVSKGLHLGGVPRRELFITSKVPGCGLHGVRKSMCEEDTLQRVRDDIKQLSSAFPVNYVDLMLLHFPPCMSNTNSSLVYPFDTDCYKHQNGCSDSSNCAAIMQQWRALEHAYEANLTRAIGVSNYCSDCFSCLANSSVQPMVNQVQYHVGMGPNPEGIVSSTRASGIVLMAYSPLGCSGRSCPQDVRKQILSGNLTTSIAQLHGKSAAQIALKWILTNNVTLATLSSNPEHLEQDLDIFDFDLSPQEIAHLNAAEFASENPPCFLCHNHRGARTIHV